MNWWFYNIVMVSSAKNERLLYVQFRPCFNWKWFWQEYSNNTDNYFNIMIWWKLISAKVQDNWNWFQQGRNNNSGNYCDVMVWCKFSLVKVQILLWVLRRSPMMSTCGNNSTGNQISRTFVVELLHKVNSGSWNKWHKVQAKRYSNNWN